MVPGRCIVPRPDGPHALRPREEAAAQHEGAVPVGAPHAAATLLQALGGRHVEQQAVQVVQVTVLHPPMVQVVLGHRDLRAGSCVRAVTTASSGLHSWQLCLPKECQSSSSGAAGRQALLTQWNRSGLLSSPELKAGHSQAASLSRGLGMGITDHNVLHLLQAESP